MRRTIRNFRLVFIELICLNCIFFGFLINAIGEKCSETNANRDSLEISISNTIFYSNYNQPETFIDTGKYFVVLKNNRNCIDCFRSINEFVRELKKNVSAEFIAIAFIDSSSLDRKRNYNSNKNLLPDFDKYCFQYRKSTSQTIFEKLETNYTPEIILINRGIPLHIPYQNLFAYQSMNISETTQLEIFNFLK